MEEREKQYWVEQYFPEHDLTGWAERNRPPGQVVTINRWDLAPGDVVVHRRERIPVVSVENRREYSIVNDKLVLTLPVTVLDP